MDLGFYHGLHETEFERHERLQGRADAFIALLTTLCGLLGFLVLGFKSPDPAVSFLFWGLVTVAALALAISIGFVITSYMAPVLRDIDKPSVWREWLAKLEAQYQAGGTHAFSSAQAEFDDHLIKTYIDATDSNIDSNTLRGFRLRHGLFALFAAFALLVAAFGGYCYATNHASSANGKETLMSCENVTVTCAPKSADASREGKPGTRPVPSPAPRPPPRS